jgi:hypothetical protein
MACVLTLAVIEDHCVNVGHVGDTRLYKLQPGRIKKITHDHSLIGLREEKGAISEIEAMRHPLRNEVFRDIGTEPHTPDDEDFIEIAEIEFELDSGLLLCSDGLSDLVTSAEIRRIVEENAGNPEAVVQRLIEAANRAGGKDNVTAVFIENELYSAAVRQHSEIVTAREPMPISTLAGQENEFNRKPENPKPTTFWHKLMSNRLTIFALGAIFGAVLFGLWQNLIRQRLNKPEAVSTAPRTLVVRQGGKKAYPTIAAALEQARPGDTVMVEPGQYAEQIRLKEGVVLESQNLHQAAIRLPQTINDAQVTVIANGIRNGRFSGFKIVGDEKSPMIAGLQLSDADVEVTDLDVSGAAEAGIRVSGRSAARITACFIHDNFGSGVVVEDVATPRLKSNQILRNGKRSRAGKPGIEIRQQSHPVLIENLIAGNSAEAIWTSGESSEDDFKQNLFGVEFKGNAKGRLKVVRSERARR